MAKVRTRFAPSPTGYLHIGGARTALFNWLYARNQGGIFLLRIEDTDLARSTEEAVSAILESMKWLGLDWDEGPFYQSKRLSIYREFAEKLLSAGKAYHAEPDPAGRKAVIFKIPHEKVVLEDLIYGRIEFDNSLQNDLVIIKSDGMPTYNYACTVDDALMNITHVIRGDDHISNTPKQIPLYQALGFDLPKFAHVPMILGEDKSRLSKRHGATSVTNYEDEGFLPEALVNYLVLLGWSPGDNREIFTKEEMVKDFDLSKVSKKSAVFSMDKLKWMNAQYIKGKGIDELAAVSEKLLEKSGVKNVDRNELKAVIELHRERLKVVKDLVDLGGFFFKENIVYSDELLNKFIRTDEIPAALKTLRDQLKDLPQFQTDQLEKICRGLAEKHNMKGTKLFQPIRVAITGQTTSPGLFETMVVLGKEKVLKRLDRVLEAAK